MNPETKTMSYLYKVHGSGPIARQQPPSQEATAVSLTQARWNRTDRAEWATSTPRGPSAEAVVPHPPQQRVGTRLVFGAVVSAPRVVIANGDLPRHAKAAFAHTSRTRRVGACVGLANVTVWDLGETRSTRSERNRGRERADARDSSVLSWTHPWSAGTIGTGRPAYRSADATMPRRVAEPRVRPPVVRLRYSRAAAVPAPVVFASIIGRVH